MKAERADLSCRGQTLLQEAHDGCRRNFARLLVAPALVLRVPRREPALRQHDAVRDADQIHVGEQHPGPRVAIVHQHVDPCLLELVMPATSRPLPSGLGSPATTLRRSATCDGSGRSRPKLTPVRWNPSSFAPHTKSLIAATARSAITLTFFAPSGPM